jgi:pyridoxal 5'-phosphate synthase pdxT subunit
VTAPTIGVFALQGDVREHLSVLTALGAKAVKVRRPAELDEVDGLILPGGESTTMVKLAMTFELFEPLRKRVAEGMPSFGSCAGMILLADRIEGGIAGQPTLGGLDVVVRRNAFGRQVASFEADLEVAGIDGAPVHAVFIRAPWVESTGENVEVLARVHGGPADGRVVAVRGGVHDHLLATSFHPELTGDPRVHELFLKIVRERS